MHRQRVSAVGPYCTAAAEPLPKLSGHGRAEMQRVGDEVHLDEDEARSGSTPHIVRYVLLASLVLAILAMSAIWISRAWWDQPPSQGHPVTAEEHALGN